MMHRRYLSVVALLALFSLTAFAQPAAPVQPATTKPTTPAPEPWIKSVTHDPQQPKSNQPVKITAALLPNHADVTLQYQVVEPGNYVEYKDPDYARNWTPVPMTKSGEGTGRTLFSATLPADLQKHRRLIRYRVAAKDPNGKPILAPVIPAKIATATSPATPEQITNYAYFVYDGLPEWKGAIQPGSPDPQRGQPYAFTPAELARVRPYTLIGKKDSVERATWRDQARDNEYRFTGTLVVDGVAYDHVRYRARGGIWRYSMGKNQWKFDFPDNHRLRAADDYGNAYPVAWSKLNLRACIQQGNYGRRGEHGLYEAVGYRMFNLAGVPAPNTHFVHFRVIDSEAEAPLNQYKGDFWGLYLAVENEDGRFLKAHNLPDGNLYKMQQGGGGEPANVAPPESGQPTDGSDLNNFLASYERQDPPEAWWRENVDLPGYYSYRAVLECIHHYDIAQGKNYDYFHNPKTNKWQVIPWDLDLTWGDHMYGDGNEPLAMRILSKGKLNREFQNRLREVRDLLFNPEQTGKLIDEYVEMIADPKSPQTSFVEADRRKWDYHPALAIGGGRAGQGQFYAASPTQDFLGMVNQMKSYIVRRGRWVDQMLLNDAAIPTTPAIGYAGPPNHPADQLKFQPAPYQAKGPFAAAKWRIADVTPTPPRTPRNYEITATWESEDLPKLEPITIPAADAKLKPGHTYRVRLKTKDTTGRWSHWSQPVEFTTAK